MSPLRGQTVKMPRMRKVIGDNMMKALHGQAQLTSVVEVDITKLMRMRNKAKDAFAAREGVKLSPMPFFVKAAVQALKAHPVVNARINEDEGTITYFDTENIGIAVDAEKGLMTPVIKDAGDLNIAGIAKQDGGPGGQGPREQDHAGRAVRCDLHHQQHRFARCAVRHRHRAAEPGRASWASVPPSSARWSSTTRSSARPSRCAT